MRHFYKIGFIFFALIFLLVGYNTSKDAEATTYFKELAFSGDTAHGLIGRYYNDVSGSSFDTLVFQRIDSVVHFDWGDGSPEVGVVQENDFSVRWIGLVEAPATGSYTFYFRADDHVRLFVNGTKLGDNFGGGCCGEESGTIDLVAGRLYPIVMEIHENGGGASTTLEWDVPDGDRSVISSRYLYAINPQRVGRPSLDPKPHLFEGEAFVKVISPTKGAIVHYTLDGNDPTTESPVYDPARPIQINSSTMLKVRAFKNGMYPSAIVSGYYTIIPPLVAAPEFYPSEGVYKHPQEITVSTPEAGAEIYYTIDGSIPTTASTPYTGPVKIDSTTRLKAIAVKEGLTDSKVTSATYTIRPKAVEAPVFSIPAGDYGTKQTVTITCNTSGAIIHYALNDKVLNEASSVYTQPLTIDKTTTLKAYAEKEGLNASDPTIATYIIGGDKDTVAAPEFSTPEGHYNGIVQVALFSETDDATIFYTLDGSTPDVNSTSYFTPILVKDSVEVKAFASRHGMEPSPVVSATYVIDKMDKDTTVITDELPEPEVKIFPNPAAEQARISWKNLIYTKQGTYVTITDSKGTVMKRVLIKGGYTYYVLNTSIFADGIYFIKIQSGDSVILGKLIIHH